MVAVAHMCTAIALSADVKADIPSPDGKTVVSVIEREGQVYYQVEHDGKRFVHSSRLGLRTNAFDFSLLEFVTSDFERIQGTYSMDRSKASEMSYDVTKAVLTFKNPKDKTIQIEFPMPDENNGNGTSEPGIAIPGGTPWRTITLGKDLAPIVETTVAWDHIEPLYETRNDYQFGKSAWSWIVWQDASMNMPDQKAYVDMASEMGLPYLLVDALWDQNLGYEGIEELAAYAKSKNVDLFLWYSSSGWWNDIVQGPYNVMSNPILRKRDMRWMKEIGVKGILEKLGLENAPVRLIDGGNEPVESAVKASRKVSVAKNDAAILVIG